MNVSGVERVRVPNSTKSNDKKMAVDKFAFSFDLFNNFTKIYIKSWIRHNFGSIEHNTSKIKYEKWKGKTASKSLISFYFIWFLRVCVCLKQVSHSPCTYNSLTLSPAATLLFHLSSISALKKSFINSVWPSSNFNCVYFCLYVWIQLNNFFCSII